MKHTKKVTVLSIAYLALTLAALGVNIALHIAKEDERKVLESQKEWFEI